MLFCAASFLLGLTQPLFFELGAELTYPANEGVSAGLVSGMLNAAGLVLCVSPSTLSPKNCSAHGLCAGWRCWRTSRRTGRAC